MGDIELSVTRSDGSVGLMIVKDVYHVPGFFVNIISHSKIRETGLYYHGWSQKILLGETNEEYAYAPEIDRLPTLLLADNKLQAAEALSFATVMSTSKETSEKCAKTISLQWMHEMFGHINPEYLTKMVSIVDGLKLSDTKKFYCETCCLSNSKEFVSREPVQRAAAPLDKVHIDVVGPVTPTGSEGERY